VAVRLIDLSHPIVTGMPVWPGDPPVVLSPATTIAGHGYNLLALQLGSQTGTHVDAPFHVDDGLPGLDALPLERFVGPAVVVDLRHLPDREPIQPEHLAPVRSRLRAGIVLLLCTGRSIHWGSARYAEHPWLRPDTATAILAAGVRTVGIDAPSVDRSTDVASDPLPALAAHQVLAGGHAVIAENLTRLETLLERVHAGSGAVVWLLPLAIAGADGSPVRAVAQLV